MKRKWKKFLSILIVFALLIQIIEYTSINVYAETNNGQGMSLAQLQAKFPNGAYWNHTARAGHGDPCGTCNNPNGYTWSQCANHGGTGKIGDSDCNVFDGALQCKGFALKLGMDAYGSSPRGWSTTNINNVKPGDILHYKDSNTDSYWGHWVMIIAVNGNNLTVGECNNGGRCKIVWGRVLNKTSIWSVTVYSAPYTLTSVTPTVPTAPSTITVNSANIGIGDSITVNWGASNSADSYVADLQCTSNSAYNQSKEVTGTSTSFLISNTGTYKVSVYAKNSIGNSGRTASGEVVTHPNVTVTYKDYDGTELKTQSVKYGGAGTPPAAPSREGYTFQGWSRESKGLTTDTTITATYLINTYTVKFVDEKGNQIGASQRVDYGSAATPPTNFQAPTGYIFVGWDKEDYKNVKDNLTITAIFVWENENLPIVTEILSAKRNEEATGYNIRLRLTNFPKDYTRVKIITALKTEAGKMVASETDTVSVPVSGEVTKEVFLMYSGLASKVEVSIVGVVDEETTGTPKSNSVETVVDIGNEWSDWSGNPLPEGEFISEERTEYRYKDKQVIRALTQPSTPIGHTFHASSATGTYSDWGAWSGWNTTPYSSSALVNAESRTAWRFYAFVCWNCGARDPYSGACSGCGAYSLYWAETYIGSTGYGLGYGVHNSAKGYVIYNGVKWYFEFNGTSDGQGGYGQPARTEWRYRTRSEYYDYTYWMSDWSAWQPEKVSESNSRQVESRQAYRFKNNSMKINCYNYKRYKYQNLITGKYIYAYSSVYADSMEYPGEWEYNKSFSELKKIAGVDDDVDIYNGYGDESWYRADVNEESEVKEFLTFDTLEDTNGTERTVTGILIGAEGKVVTLVVYKGKNIDPTASQLEYVGQTTVDENGKYNFVFKTKEDPSIKTGDFIISLGVEGATDLMYLETIKAPKPSYTVEFISDADELIDTQIVMEGNSAVSPEAPSKAGYDFIGWDTSITNVRENLIAKAIYQKKKYTVVFINWDNTSVDIAEFEYGDSLNAEVIPKKFDGKFEKWVDENGNDVTTITRNMVVTAKYKDAMYVVTILDWDGNVIEEKEVAFGESINLPAIEEPEDTLMKFAYWSSCGEEEMITRDLVITPVAEYNATTAQPSFNKASGTYSEGQIVTMSCSTKNAKIYYYKDSVDLMNSTGYESKKGEGILYTGPIAVVEDTVLYAYAVAENMNQSSFSNVEIIISSEKDNEKETQSKITVTGISLNYKSKTLDIKDTFSIITSVSPKTATNKELKYISSNTNVVTVNEKGVVTAKKAGSAVITVMSKENSKITAKCTVTVKPSVPKSISIKKKTGTSANISWKKVTDATGYEIYRSGKKNSGFKKITTVKSVNKVSYTNNKLKKKKIYYYKIRSYKTINGKKVYSNYSTPQKVKL